MEKGQSSEAMDGEIHLHEAIIQHIQSFHSCKEAAQTSLLCKSWYNAWATRSILYLDQRHFQCRGGADGFLEYSKEIVRRYEKSKLKLESFRFCVENIESDCASVVNELIVDAMNLGACDLNFEIMQRTTEFNLSHEVLRSENLVRLSVRGCRIYLEAIGGELVCPFIEELVLSESECTPICTVPSFGDSVGITTMLALRSLTEFEKQTIVDARIRPYDNLKSLYMERVVINRLLFKDMSRSFPCLKDLTLNFCGVLMTLTRVPHHSTHFSVWCKV